MTTTNGGDRGRIVEHAEGWVQAANERGVHLVGEADWRNFSKYAQPAISPPRPGQHVICGLDASGYIREPRVEPGVDTPSAAIDSDRDRQIRRMSALRSAAAFCAGKAVSGEVSSQDVLKVAAAIEAWLTRES